MDREPEYGEETGSISHTRSHADVVSGDHCTGPFTNGPGTGPRRDHEDPDKLILLSALPLPGHGRR